MKNEFRINNFIKINNPTYRECQVGHICSVNEIREDGLNLTDVDMRARPTFGQLWKFIEPIELTEEWLIKFGFKKSGIGYGKGLLNIYMKNAVITYPNGRVFYNSWAIMEYQIKYVHQLQNLYFALTCEELYPV